MSATVVFGGVDAQGGGKCLTFSRRCWRAVNDQRRKDDGRGRTRPSHGLRQSQLWPLSSAAVSTFRQLAPRPSPAETRRRSQDSVAAIVNDCLRGRPQLSCRRLHFSTTVHFITTLVLANRQCWAVICFM